MTINRRFVAAAVALVLVGDAAALALIEPAPSDGMVASKPARQRDKAQKVAPPDKWDPRVVDLAAFVEDERGLKFKHPVAVRFLEESAYRVEVSAEQKSELSKEEREEIALFTGQARALGLLPKSTDLLDALGTVVDEGTLAFYDSDRKEMVVRGTEVTVGVRTTVVHELTHAAQDQHFDISRSFKTSGGDALFQALVEGDATRIEQLYVASLDEKDQEEYLKEDSAVRNDVADELDGVPPALLQLIGAPYALGAPMAAIVEEEKGQSELDRFFREPIESDEGMINPFALLDREKPKKVAVPKVRSGEKRTDDGDFGSVTWYVVLASFVDPRIALKAVDGWAGDSYVGYKRAGRSCLRIDFQGDTPADDDEMLAALQEWKKPFEQNRVTVTRLRSGVELDACEPDSVPTPRSDADAALALPAARLGVVSQVLAEGASPAVARCFAKEFVNRVDPATLSDDGADERTFVNLGLAIAKECAGR